MAYKNKERQREYQKLRARIKKLKGKEKHKAVADFRLKFPKQKIGLDVEKRKETIRKWKQRKRDEAEKILGDKCFFCTRTNNLCYHKKDNEYHCSSLSAALVLKNPEKWVRLCHPCHRAVHWIYEFFAWDWDTIVKKWKIAVNVGATPATRIWTKRNLFRE